MAQNISCAAIFVQLDSPPIGLGMQPIPCAKRCAMAGQLSGGRGGQARSGSGAPAAWRKTRDGVSVAPNVGGASGGDRGGRRWLQAGERRRPWREFRPVAAWRPLPRWVSSMPTMPGTGRCARLAGFLAFYPAVCYGRMRELISCPARSPVPVPSPRPAGASPSAWSPLHGHITKRSHASRRLPPEWTAAPVRAVPPLWCPLRGRETGSGRRRDRRVQGGWQAGRVRREGARGPGPVGRRHSFGHLRPGGSARVAQLRAAAASGLPLDRQRRRLHRRLVDRVAQPGAQRRETKEGRGGRQDDREVRVPAGGGRESAPCRDPPPARVRQLPLSAQGLLRVRDLEPGGGGAGRDGMDRGGGTRRSGTACGDLGRHGCRPFLRRLRLPRRRAVPPGGGSPGGLRVAVEHEGQGPGRGPSSVDVRAGRDGGPRGEWRRPGASTLHRSRGSLLDGDPGGRRIGPASAWAGAGPGRGMARRRPGRSVWASRPGPLHLP